MSWTQEEIKQMTGVLLRRVHGDGRDQQEVETVCLLAETSIMNRESCGEVMEENEQLKAEIVKLKSLASPSGWQSIESAPKDGREILGINDHGNMDVINWSPGMEWFVGMDQGFEPTHWMPLPTPPTDGKEKV